MTTNISFELLDLSKMQIDLTPVPKVELDQWMKSFLKGRHVSDFLGSHLTWDDFDAKKIDRPTARPVQSTARQSHCRASASRTRVTGSNAKKATSGSGGSDPDPERRHTFPLAFIGFDAASFGGAAA